MIYSNACYAPGASEGSAAKAGRGGGPGPRRELLAWRIRDGRFRVLRHRLLWRGRRLVHALIDQSGRTFADVFRSEPQFRPDALSRHRHPQVAGTQIWLHRSAYFDGKVDYWYAFAGSPRARMADARVDHPVPPAGPASMTLTGMASSYRFTHGFETTPTVALPVAIGGSSPGSKYGWVGVCADRCARLPVVDVCDCFYGTDDQTDRQPVTGRMAIDQRCATGGRRHRGGPVPRRGDPAGAGPTPLALAVDPKPPGMKLE